MFEDQQTRLQPNKMTLTWTLFYCTILTQKLIPQHSTAPTRGSKRKNRALFHPSHVTTRAEKRTHPLPSLQA